MIRYNHIDALRAFAMSFGVILHARAFLGERAGEAIASTSYIFRMPTFFIIAGFFAAMVFSRLQTEQALRERLRLILIPCIFFLLFANPIAIIALFQIAGEPLPPLETFLSILPDDPNFPLKPSWHLHLWFLVALASFTALYPLVRWALSKIDLPKRLPQNPTLAFSALLILTAGASFTLHSAYNLTLENIFGTTSLNYTFVSSARLFPFFVLGILLHQSSTQFNLFHKFHAIPFALSIIAVIYLNYNPDLPGYTLLMRAASAAASFCSANLLFALFQRFFAQENKTARLFSESSYTLYLLHYYVLIALFACFYRPGMQSPLSFLFAITICYAICLALHVFVVSRYRVPRLLVNGKVAKMQTWPARSTTKSGIATSSARPLIAPSSMSTVTSSTKSPAPKPLRVSA